ncbi:DNA polymerase alpha/epsilon subunit B-domain-containing protein, partial [Gorgonomyces haynaldii]
MLGSNQMQRSNCSFQVTRTYSNQKSFTQQYAGVYFTRLSLLRPRVLETCKREWGHLNVEYKSKLIDIEQGQSCYLIGTLFVDRKLKPNIISDITRDQWEQKPADQDKYISDADEFVVEDESGRCVVVGQLLQDVVLCTGMIVGFLGSEDQSGHFNVLDVCFPSAEPQSPLEPKDCWIALVSGLEFGVPDLKCQLLLDYLTGESGSDQDQQLVKQIVRVIICGESLAPSQAKFVKNRFGTDELEYEPTAMDHLDQFISVLASNVDVDLLPGKQDLTSHLMPQTPVNHGMFQKSCLYSSFHSVYNPHMCQMDTLSLILTSGQTVDTIYKYCVSTDRLDMAEATLKACHLAPVAPDLLWSYPYKDEDPFIIDERPHVYVIGNQPQFETRLVSWDHGQTKIVLLPKFSQTKQIVLLHTGTLETKVVQF